MTYVELTKQNELYFYALVHPKLVEVRERVFKLNYSLIKQK